MTTVDIVYGLLSGEKTVAFVALVEGVIKEDHRGIVKEMRETAEREAVRDDRVQLVLPQEYMVCTLT